MTDKVFGGLSLWQRSKRWRKRSYTCNHELCHPLDRIFSPFVRHNAWGGTGWRLPGMRHAFLGDVAIHLGAKVALRNLQWRWDELWMMPLSFGRLNPPQGVTVLYEGETYGTGERVYWEPFDGGDGDWGWLTTETWPETKGDYLMGLRRQSTQVLLMNVALGSVVADLAREKSQLSSQDSSQ